MRGKRQRLHSRSEPSPSISRFTPQFSLLGGGTAWLLHFFAIYLIGEFGCTAGWGHWIVGGLSMVTWLLLFVTALALVAAGAAIGASAHMGKALRCVDGDHAAATAESRPFVARLSLVLNGIFAFIIIVQAVPIFFYLRAC